MLGLYLDFFPFSNPSFFEKNSLLSKNHFSFTLLDEVWKNLVSWKEGCTSDVDPPDKIREDLSVDCRSLTDTKCFHWDFLLFRCLFFIFYWKKENAVYCISAFGSDKGMHLPSKGRIFQILHIYILININIYIISGCWNENIGVQKLCCKTQRDAPSVSGHMNIYFFYIPGMQCSQIHTEVLWGFWSELTFLWHLKQPIRFAIVS